MSLLVENGTCHDVDQNPRGVQYPGMNFIASQTREALQHIPIKIELVQIDTCMHAKRVKLTEGATCVIP